MVVAPDEREKGARRLIYLHWAIWKWAYIDLNLSLSGTHLHGHLGNTYVRWLLGATPWSTKLNYVQKPKPILCKTQNALDFFLENPNKGTPINTNRYKFTMLLMHFLNKSNKFRIMCVVTVCPLWPTRISSCYVYIVQPQIQ